jgi:hypothetical protein
MGRAYDAFDPYDEDYDAAIPPLPPSRPPPASALEHARRMLDRALRGQAVNEARMRRAGGGGQDWGRASDLAGRALAAQRAAARWAQELQRLTSSQGPYRFDDDAFDDAYDDEVDAAMRLMHTPLQRARWKLSHAQQALPYFDRRFDAAARAQQWTQAEQIARHARGAEASAKHWANEVQRLRALSAAFR